MGCVFQMWNNSKSPIRYTWGKISHCHIIEVEPCTGVIGTLGASLGWLQKKVLELKGPAQGPWCLVISSSMAWGTQESKNECRPDTRPSHRRKLLHLPFPSLPEANEVGDFELNFTGGVPGPASQDLLCEIRDSPSPVVLHIEGNFKVLQMGAGQQGGPSQVAGVGRRAHSPAAR